MINYRLFFAKAIIAFIPLLALAGTKADIADGYLPDPKLTPGVVDPSVTLEQMCTTSTKLRRHVTQRMRKEAFKRYNIPFDPQKFETDHLIPLALGGANDKNNLWPEMWLGVRGAHTKDILESKMRFLVCSHQLDLATAQHEIATNWLEAYDKYIASKK